ncbi:hypothetical protein P5673_031385 [Acropora cervicornis]|uniref:Uncharacterized protein n=1 Tax=Acropora cervicornis TaxID=6130 RepID=A0AAD9PSU4_ACRCE|nr:hypothetical protein P5673_031385 [Acropora cervicornis]
MEFLIFSSILKGSIDCQRIAFSSSCGKDIPRPRMPATHDGLSKAQGCLWYSLANWEDKLLRPNRSCGP